MSWIHYTETAEGDFDVFRCLLPSCAQESPHDGSTHIGVIEKTLGRSWQFVPNLITEDAAPVRASFSSAVYDARIYTGEEMYQVIAKARDNVPRLVAALTAVLDLCEEWDTRTSVAIRNAINAALTRGGADV